MRQDVGLHWGGGRRRGLPFGILDVDGGGPVAVHRGDPDLVGPDLGHRGVPDGRGAGACAIRSQQASGRGGASWGIVQLYVLACVAAPVVEETMFRGVLLTATSVALMRTLGDAGRDRVARGARSPA